MSSSLAMIRGLVLFVVEKLFVHKDLTSHKANYRLWKKSYVRNIYFHQIMHQHHRTFFLFFWLRKGVDNVSMNPDHVLIDAKNKALDMVEGYKAPVEPVYHLPGKSGRAAIRMNVDTMYMRGDDPNKGVNHVDVKIADCLADVTTGGETVSQEQVESHVADHKDRVRELISASNDQETDVYQGIPLTEARILQLERNGIMTLAHTDTTSKRLAYMVEKKKPLREKHLDPMANPSELRNELERVSLPLRSATGKPLDGEAEERLQSMAKTSRTALNIAKKLGLA